MIALLVILGGTSFFSFIVWLQKTSSLSERFTLENMKRYFCNGYFVMSLSSALLFLLLLLTL